MGKASSTTRAGDPATAKWLRQSLVRWGRLWKIPGLPDGVDIIFSPRLHSRLGLCRPESSQIRLSAALLDGRRRRLLGQVLCHEAAHVAAYRLYGKQHRAHSPRWAALVQAAGHRPLVRLDLPTPRSVPHRRRRATRYLYEHHCPVCQMVRLARRPVTRWRCAQCVADGLPGTLDIIRRTPAEGGGP